MEDTELEQYCRETYQENVLFSKEVGEIAAALSAAQSSNLLAKESESNPYFRSKYANLAQLWSCCREALTANGLSVSQLLNHTNGKVLLVTLLMHTSGQWLKSSMVLDPPKKDAQSMGSYITYMRRYALAAIVGIAPGDKDDDDAEKVMKESRAPKPNFTPRKKTEIGEVIMKLSDQLNAEGLEPKVLMDYLKHFSEKKSVSVNEMAQSAVDSPGMFIKHYQRWLVEKA